MHIKDFGTSMPIGSRPVFNPDGADADIARKRLLNGNTTNLNDFNNMKYKWAADWYRQAMNNFWIPEEVSLAQDVKDYPLLTEAERTAYDKILSFLIFLDSVQTANLPVLGRYIFASEVNLCLNIQSYQETIHSQSYSYMLDTICSPEKRDSILYQWKMDAKLLKRNKLIGGCYNNFILNPSMENFMDSVIANYLLEGIYFYSGFMFFYNLARNGKMPGSAQVIRYINRDENTHLWLFRNIIKELQEEEPMLFAESSMKAYRKQMKQGVNQEIAWAEYAIGDSIPGLSFSMVESYIRYLGNLRAKAIGFEPLYDGYEKEPEGMEWVSAYANANMVKTDFFEARPTAYAKSASITDDL